MNRARQAVAEGAETLSGCITVVFLFLVIFSLMYVFVQFTGPF